MYTTPRAHMQKQIQRNSLKKRKKRKREKRSCKGPNGREYIFRHISPVITKCNIRRLGMKTKLSINTSVNRTKEKNHKRGNIFSFSFYTGFVNAV